MSFPEYPFFKTSVLREFLKSKSSAPLKKWGQNFLIDPKAVQSLIDSADPEALQSSEIILEIGPGLGALSHLLIRFKKKLRLYEIDPVYAEWLEHFLPGAEIVRGDARETLRLPPDTDCFLFGNLPYYITSELIILALERLNGLKGAVFLVQKEFAVRLTKEISSLGIYAGAYGIFKLRKRIKAGCFYPAPNIDSSILSFKSAPRFAERKYYQALELLCRVAFWGKRKKLSSSLKEAPIRSFYPKGEFPFQDKEDSLRSRLSLAVKSAEISIDKRPEELKQEDFYLVAEKFPFN
ncbi:ribosomal RNA small subunit methyltransferase A [Leptospira fainei serovar Hurstbridge str. BUT 6]|uniref:Ribosomal RNA small subunit methyltransferase A n=1 Tax=Leptospira fainei serovar Hurstbridge str. BUT 6 TaxID=1193011 RepID=S3UWS2_9LEPT|nr:16S rRNA (adenine(1518)-N(6)/adenine(1519)-N(6))-dimethyltransferase RsmA [Leptospira fainei]EPG73723.1 ribosomal RNA small subunit methyltransferase A [Leptospira fainei serovar Hurstbridge str. BUT 6]